MMSVAAHSQSGQHLVDFVGCPSGGQAGYVAPPEGEPRRVTLTEVSAGEIAYYKGSMAPGAFGPHGWHCHAWYGSGGATLLITPEELDHAPGIAWPAKTSAPAIELSLNEGGTSGRYEVARYALLFFPNAVPDFTRMVKEMEVDVSKSSPQLFAKDSVKPITGTMAEFVTPGDAEGFGTEQYLKPSSDPVSGIALLDISTYGPNFISVRIRLRASSSRLKSALIRLNQECMQAARGCSTW
jgi:hypothetical protein